MGKSEANSFCVLGTDFLKSDDYSFTLFDDLWINKESQR